MDGSNVTDKGLEIKMNKITYPILALIIFMSTSLFINAYAVDNNCLITPKHILLIHISLGCIEDRLDALENASSGDLTTASNLGSVGEGIFASEVGNDLQFKKLVGGTGITLASNATRITIDSSGGAGESTVCNNVGTGNPLHKSGTNCSAFSLIAGTGILIANTTDDYTISSDNEYVAIATVYQSATKTNLPVTYTDVHVTLFDMENAVLNSIDLDGYTDIRIMWLWDFVGAGTDRVRWVNVSNASQVLYESATFGTDCDPCSAGWQTIPDFAKNTERTYEWQALSSNGTNDPIARGYRILVR